MKPCPCLSCQRERNRRATWFNERLFLVSAILLALLVLWMLCH